MKKRGEIYLFNFSFESEGREIREPHPCIVVSRTSVHPTLNVIIIVPTSSNNIERQKQYFPNVHLPLGSCPGLDRECVAQCHQVRSIDPTARFASGCIGTVPEHIMQKIDEKLLDILGLPSRTVSVLRKKQEPQKE